MLEFWCWPPSPLVGVTHHDQHHRFFRCNYATHFTLWDRLMGTYRDQPAAGHLNMTIGLPYFRELRFSWLPWLLLIPLLDTGDGREKGE